MKQAGEVLRRVAFFGLDMMRGGKMKRLLEVNKSEIVRGITQEYQDRRLDQILTYAAENCEFYRNLPANGSLTDFPVQNKGDFIEHYEGILSDEFRDDRDKLTKLSTSGSTGTPFTVLADKDKMSHVYMNFMSVMELNGFRLGMKRGEFRAWIKGKNTISKWHSVKNNLLMIDISNMGDESVKAILDRIKRDRIQVLVAYSSAIQALCDYVDRSGYDTAGWSVEMIFTMGEALPAGTRKKAAELFGITPVLSYGNNENGFVAVSLDGSDLYTIDLYNYYVEILKMDSDEPADEGELGRIVVTDFYNRAFPMIRYDTGDTGKIRKYKDDEGRLHACFTEIYGRRGSLLYNTKGEPLSIHVFMNVLLNFEGEIQQAKCIQTGEKEYTLEINALKLPIDEEKVVSAYRHYLGDDAVITVEYLEGRIPIQQSGKTMVCENRWKR
ncbi:MAG: phenylacetate--CoA ligase family protein [Lachnospiraceae bacterium]|nr:phenylacetate--CoA ligase family protein [Lachnospiraceae bacterium]